MPCIRKLNAVLLALALGLAGIYPAYADNHWDDDWEIKVDSKAKSAGTISFQVTFKPEDGVARESVTVDVLVPDGTGENDIAELIATAFKAVLGEEDFKIKRHSGEEVDVETRGKTPDMVLELISNSVQGTTIEIDD